MNSSSLHFNRDQHFQDLISHIEEKDPEDIQVPQNYSKILRDYQVQGFKWLKTMSEYGFGGILADDMGLGKTLQVIALLCAEYEREVDKPSLIVTPSSLVFNWQAEFERFAPHLRVLTMTGTVSERSKKLSTLNNYDVILTSYDLLRRDIKEYEAAFKYVILDEAHYIKNQRHKMRKAVKN